MSRVPIHPNEPLAGHVTILEAARAAGVTVGTMKGWIKAGRLPAEAVQETEDGIWINKAELRKAIRKRHGRVQRRRDPSALSPNEAAEVLGVTGEAVKQWIRRGVLKATKLANGYWRIAPEDLKSFLETRQNLSAALYIAGTVSKVSRIFRIAEDLGCKAKGVGNLVVALKAMREVPAKALVVDPSFFGDGLGLIRRIRKTSRYGSPRVLLLNPAPPSEQETAELVRLGVGGCLVGQVPDAVLRAEVTALLANTGR